MKFAATVIRQKLGIEGQIFSDRRKDRPGFRKVVAIKIPFETLNPDLIQLAIQELTKAGFTVLKHYFFTPYKVQGQENRHGVEGYRFIVGYPQEVPAVPYEVEYENRTPTIITHPSTKAILRDSDGPNYEI